jgi:mannose-6-phosphate isomerase class I
MAAQCTSNSPGKQVGRYRLRPILRLPSGKARRGFDDLARQFVGQPAIRIDGYVGIDWATIRDRLTEAFLKLGIDAAWFAVSTAERPADEIELLAGPCLGGADPVFGTRFEGSLADFFDLEKLRALPSSVGDKLAVYYGCGAALIDVEGPLVYVDLPKDELQRRSRQGSVSNLGAAKRGSAKQQYKRFYFVDWPALNRHKSEIIRRVDWLIDGRNEADPTFLRGDDFRAALDELGRNVLRARPWFAPGPWGGQWLKRRVPEAPQDVPNYAWSFELIAPENGLVFGDQATAVEASFDWLMYYRRREVLGDSADRFGDEFPIRFDFLDTIDGGNLSVQCHPRPEYIQRCFGEKFTQDETYYILDCEPGARVYLGFQGDCDPAEFRTALERSFAEGTPVDVDRFVASHPAEKHDLFLIPHGTIHCSGAGNMVLEISATPYIFTFKMYDWLRADLDGTPRPLNIERAFDNLDFSRRGDAVRRELISKPVVVAEAADFRIVHLPTHPDHFYDVHRLEFSGRIEVETLGSPHVLMLVEGDAVTIETEGGAVETFYYAETFVVPAAAGAYGLTYHGPGRGMVVKAFVKSSACARESHAD